MQTLPSNWGSVEAAERRYEIKASIAGVDYLAAGNDIHALSVHASLFAQDTPSIGGCVAREIDLVVKPQGNIPRMAEIRVYVRAVADGIETDWLQKGIYYIDTRQKNYSNGTLTIHGYDAMLKAEQDYLGEVDTESWPQPVQTVVEKIAERMGVTVDARTVLNSAFMVEYPVGLTMREVLSYIAAAHGGNWIITDAGELRLVPLKPSGVAGATSAVLGVGKLGQMRLGVSATASGSIVNVGMKALSLDTSPPLPAITGVRLWIDDKTAVKAGNETGYLIEADCLWATPAIAEAALEAMAGYQYQPYEAQGAALDPAAELGDAVSVGGVTSVLACIDTEFDAMCAADISAPADEEIDHEYPYTSKQERTTTRRFGQVYSTITKTAEEIRSEVSSIEVGARNLIRRSWVLDYETYGFGTPASLVTLAAPVIRLVTDAIAAPVIRLSVGKLAAPVIELYDEAQKLSAPVIELVKDKLDTPEIELVTEKLAAPVIELVEEAS